MTRLALLLLVILVAAGCASGTENPLRVGTVRDLLRQQGFLDAPPRQQTIRILPNGTAVSVPTLGGRTTDGMEVTAIVSGSTAVAEAPDPHSRGPWSNWVRVCNVSLDFSQADERAEAVVDALRRRCSPG